MWFFHIHSWCVKIASWITWLELCCNGTLLIVEQMRVFHHQHVLLNVSCHITKCFFSYTSMTFWIIITNFMHFHTCYNEFSRKSVWSYKFGIRRNYLIRYPVLNNVRCIKSFYLTIFISWLVPTTGTTGSWTKYELLLLPSKSADVFFIFSFKKCSCYTNLCIPVMLVKNIHFISITLCCWCSISIFLYVAVR